MSEICLGWGEGSGLEAWEVECATEETEGNQNTEMGIFTIIINFKATFKQ